MLLLYHNVATLQYIYSMPKYIHSIPFGLGKEYIPYTRSSLSTRSSLGTPFIPGYWHFHARHLATWPDMFARCAPSQETAGDRHGRQGTGSILLAIVVVPVDCLRLIFLLLAV